MSSGLMLDEEGYYTTGDRAVPDGESFIMYGRVDNVVKVGGNRIELEALEQKIKSMDSVDDAYVFQVESASGRENEIVVLVVANRGIRDLKASLRKMLSPVEMPRQVIKVNEIPATPAGKRDRQAAIRLYRSSCRIQ
jgi:acyl-coenzyme A synthetase/AMP-(fatty) acid ligase